MAISLVEGMIIQDQKTFITKIVAKISKRDYFIPVISYRPG